MGDVRTMLSALVAAYDQHRKWMMAEKFAALQRAVDHARDVLAQPEPASDEGVSTSTAGQAVEAAIAAGQPVTLPSGTVIADPAWFESRIAIRTADPLKRQALRPIPVSERLPGPDDCDAEGNCWWFSFEELAWIFADLEYAKNRRHTYWLPAHALPLPEFE